MSEGPAMTSDWSITRLEHRVHELQTAVLVMVRQLGLEEQLAAAERARLDERTFERR